MAAMHSHLREFMNVIEDALYASVGWLEGHSTKPAPVSLRKASDFDYLASYFYTEPHPYTLSFVEAYRVARCPLCEELVVEEEHAEVWHGAEELEILSDWEPEWVPVVAHNEAYEVVLDYIREIFQFNPEGRNHPIVWEIYSAGWFLKHEIWYPMQQLASTFLILHCINTAQNPDPFDWLAQVLTVTDLCHAYGSMSDHMENYGDEFNVLRNEGLDALWPDIQELLSQPDQFMAARERLSHILPTPQELFDKVELEFAQSAVLAGFYDVWTDPNFRERINPTDLPKQWVSAQIEKDKDNVGHN